MLGPARVSEIHVVVCLDVFLSILHVLGINYIHFIVYRATAPVHACTARDCLYDTSYAHERVRTVAYDLFIMMGISRVFLLIFLSLFANADFEPGTF